VAAIKGLVVALAACILVLAPASAGRAACDESGRDAVAVATARDAIAAACDCGAATSHAAYVACSRGVLAGLVANGTLPRVCRAVVQHCATSSTCGRPGAVTCCRSTERGTRGSIERSAASCEANQSRSCVGNYPSLCDACDVGGCSELCGNGKVETGEECEPPGTEICDATCHQTPGCGDLIVDPGEECDGSGDSCEFGFCGPPGGPGACTCCVTEGALWEGVGPAPTCCNGNTCVLTLPHRCSCNPCQPVSGGSCVPGFIDCCRGLHCVVDGPGVIGQCF